MKGRRLYLDGVGVVFDGFRALNNLSLVVEPGELRAVIGPNGAGKTTMMDVITGKTRPTSGSAWFGETLRARLFGRVSLEFHPPPRAETAPPEASPLTPTESL